MCVLHVASVAHSPFLSHGHERPYQPSSSKSAVPSEADIHGTMLVFGGEAPGGTFHQVEAYDAKSNGWSSQARMPTARHGLGAAAVAGKIYVISGGPTPGASASAANEIFVP